MSTVQKKQTNLREKLAELLDFRKMRDRLSGLGLYIGKDRTNTDENLLVRGGANVDDLQLGEIAALVGGTAVDVFVYDTSRDSDGGAWRKRTQHTSWYNEELNTATRGSRKEFPAVAVIVSEVGKVTIYDGDDPDLSMWMVFDVNNDVWLKHTTGNTVKSVKMLNAKLVTAGFRLSVVDFIDDSGYVSESNYCYEHNNISRRNIDGVGDSTGNVFVVNINTNDVAMTILPNAPIDENTGLPVPTIAVATDGGVSVIKDDGTVVDLNILDRPYSSVYFSGNVVWAVENPETNYDLLRYFEIPASDITIAASYGPNSSPALFPKYTKGNVFDSFNYGSPIGITKLDHENSMVAYTTSKYNTGWMPGDIKLATLSDTTVENIGVNSDELLTGDNSSFTDGVGDWVDISIGSGSVVHNTGGSYVELARADANNNARIGIGLNLQADQMYVLKFNLVDSSSSGVQVRGFKSSDNSFSANQIINSTASQDGLYTVSFRAEDGYDGIIFLPISGTNTAANLDNVSIRATTELITNGDFSTDSDWTKGTGWSISGGVASCDGTDYAILTQEDVFYNFGIKYVLTFTVSSYTSGNVEARWYDGSWQTIGSEVNGLGTYSFTFTLGGGSNGDLTFRSGAFVGSIDNVSVRPAVDDRSVNNNGLQIIGEINKAPVAPGADLLAYSGFSANDYLVQPYNEDLNFGTGDFCVMGWFKQSATTDFHTYLSREGRISVYVDAATSELNFRITDGTNHMNCLSASTVDNDTWTFFVGVKLDGATYNYINGELSQTANYATVGSLDGEFATYVGANHISGDRRPADELALWRISATAPTADQIAKIYRDEKVLFQDHAQSTLYGTSDSVTALAYDDKTELLHVGTSSGRSDFSGLRRINNTTTAVTTSISAHNNLIAEQ